VQIKGSKYTIFDTHHATMLLSSHGRLLKHALSL
jgi:hypothetical protein